MSIDGPSPWLSWLLHRVGRYLHRFGFRLVQGNGQLGDLYVSMDEAMAALHGSLGPVAAQLGLPAVDEPRPLPTPTEGLDRLARRFGLEAIDLAVFWAVAAPGLSVDIARLYRFAWADFTVKLTPAGFIAELLSDDDAGARAVLAALHPDRPLRRGRLVQLEAGERWGSSPALIHRGVAVPEPVLAFMRGEPPALAPALQRARITGPVRSTLELHPRTQAALEGIADRGVSQIILAGVLGAGRRTAFCDLARRIGLDVLGIDAVRLPPARRAALLADAAREARLRDAGLYIRLDGLADGRGGAVNEGDPATDRDPAAVIVDSLGPCLTAPPLLLGLAVEQPISALHRIARSAASLSFEPLDEIHRRDIWQRGLPEESEGDPASLARRFTVPPGVIFSAVDALAAAEPSARTTVAAEAEVRHRIHHALDEIAEPVPTPFDWDDVVLPESVLSTLREVLAHAENRARVFDEWGFADKLPYGRGLGCLFSGPPGTGKTMMAGVLARALDQALYRVDLSRVVSKWVGETEKNLARVFSEAERGQVILFFDEADSLFSTRTEVRGAHDRFANMEVNYLLQRMEAFDGMSILATNFERSIDEAFKRRIRFRVHFPVPDAEQRALLWQRMLPARMPRAEGIRFALLGKRFKLSGGNIKNAVLRAAFQAAAADAPLSQKMLMHAAEAELREMGRL